MKPRLLVAGYYGCGNLGDDALLLGLLTGLDASTVDLQVLTGNPEAAGRLYNVQGVPRKDARAIKEAIAWCDVLVFGGGSIFQDASSARSVAYYYNLVRMAKGAKKKVVLLGQGVGPLKTLVGKRLAKNAFSAADLIAVRDPDSLLALQKLGVRTRTEVTADLAYLLPKPSGPEDVTQFEMAGSRAIGLAVRPLPGRKDVPQLFASTMRALSTQGFLPILIEMDQEMDGPFILEIDRIAGGKMPSMRRMSTPMDLQRRMMRMEAVIAMRLHGGIFAANLGVPALMLDYDPKVQAFAKLSGLPPALPMAGLNPTRIVDGLQSLLARREAIRGELARSTAELQAKARRNVELLQAVIG